MQYLLPHASAHATRQAAADSPAAVAVTPSSPSAAHAPRTPQTCAATEQDGGTCGARALATAACTRSPRCVCDLVVRGARV